MLRITKSKSAGAAVDYFRKALRSADYYMEGREVTGLWHGLAASRLGLTGQVRDKDFIAVLNNRTPDGQKLTARDRPNRVPMIDFTFNAPKSVSLLWAMTQDDRFVQAHNIAVNEAMVEVERNMETRVRRGNAAFSEKSRKTGNAIWASFQQDTARPVDGTPDPHLHTHCTLVNATFDPVEKRYKAVEIKNIVGERSYYEAVYHAALASEFRKIGYEIERHGKWWDIAGVPRALIEKFSQRTQEIEAAAEKAGEISAAQKAALGVRTRSEKEEEIGTADIQTIVATRLDVKERGVLQRVVRKAAKGGATATRKSLSDIWSYGIDKAFERSSIAFEKRVMDDALRFGFGDVRLADMKVMASRATLVRGNLNGRSIISTQEMLALEERMIAIGRKGRASCKRLGHADYEISKDFLNDRQRLAIHHIWQSRDRIMIVEGDAGVGKTSGVLAEATAGIKAAGYKVATFAPTSGAVRELSKAVKAPAYTVARLLKDTRLQDTLSGGVFMVDEAGQLGVRDMTALFEIADKRHCRIILSGDTKQHGAIAAGDAMRLLQKRCGLKTARVTEIVRQKGAYRDAVAALANGDMKTGWKRLEKMGAIIEISGVERFDKVAMDYIGEVGTGRSALVVAPTHREKDAITERIRSGLKHTGALKQRDKQIHRLEDTKWTQAERRDGDLYETGMIVKAFQNMPSGIKRGERLQVIAKDDRGIPIIQAEDGRVCALPLAKAEHFKVYREASLPLAAGDLVRITEQGRDVRGRRLATGTILELKSINRNQEMLFTNGIKLDARFGHLDHGYCSTSYAAQGRTVDTVIASMGAQSEAAIYREQFYVTASRGRSAVRIYTDDREAIGRAISNSSQRLSATELFEGLSSNKDKVERQAHLKGLSVRLAADDKHRIGKTRNGFEANATPEPHVIANKSQMEKVNEPRRGIDI